LSLKYGYASSGESFSIADPDEAWIFEIIGKGPGNKGAVWVALRIPDGYISGHANQARSRHSHWQQEEKQYSITSRISRIF
jgi:dipeptidase